MWTSLLVLCIPAALGALAWVLFWGGRPAVAELAGAYLLIVVAGRAQAAEKARRAKPARLERVRTQVARVKSALAEADETALREEAVLPVDPSVLRGTARTGPPEPVF